MGNPFKQRMNIKGREHESLQKVYSKSVLPNLEKTIGTEARIIPAKQIGKQEEKSEAAGNANKIAEARG